MKANRKRTDEERGRAKVGADGNFETDSCVGLRDGTGAKKCNFISHQILGLTESDCSRFLSCCSTQNA